ncbi:MAG TPA: dicarboxylate/amino acid:cation symporter [Gemmatimonadaceae bacterium]|nr:dicarboxylate/amino acid:cation symporter [Gemmatimonadaceae bacterium]
MRLQTKIFLGLLIGLVLGFVARLPALTWLRTAIEWSEPVGTIFIRLITMVVIPLVAGSLFTSVASLGGIRRLGTIGVRTLGWFVVTTALAAVIGLAVALVGGAGAGLDPSVRDAITDRFAATAASASANVSAVPGLKQTLIAIVPQNPFAAAAQGDLLALIFAIVVFAAAATALDEERRRPLVAFFGAVNDVSMVVIRWLMVLAPWAVGVLIAVTVVRSGIDLLRSLAMYALIVVVALAIHVMLVLVPAVRFGARMGIVEFARNVGDALVLAFSTASSSVTLPVSMAAARERLGIPGEIVSFVLPAGATLNKNGAAVYKAATAVFLANLYGVDLGPGQLVTIVLTTIVASSAGAGVPGSSLVTTLIVLNAIGLGPNAAAGIALVAGIDRVLDMCRTTVNTFSNLVGAAWVARGERVGVASMEHGRAL